MGCVEGSNSSFAAQWPRAPTKSATSSMQSPCGGIESEAAIACGDSENDVEMLQLVGLGVAMGDLLLMFGDSFICDLQLCLKNKIQAFVENPRKPYKTPENHQQKPYLF